MSNLTLFDLTYRVARELGVVVERIATGGSTTTIVDNPYRNEPNDYWAGGSAWIIRDAGGASAAPEGEYAIASASTSSTWTITFPASSFTVAVAAGDRYAVCRKAGENPWLDIIVQKINQALLDMGTIPITDTTTITTVTDQTQYNLPIASNMDLRQVWIQTTDDDTDPQWMQLFDWTLKDSTTGTADVLELNSYFPAGFDLKLIYMANHPEMYTSTAQLSEHVPQELVIYPAVRDCFVHLKNSTGWDKWDKQIDEWTQKVESIRGRVSMKKPKRSPKLMLSHTGFNQIKQEYDGKVRL